MVAVSTRESAASMSMSNTRDMPSWEVSILPRRFEKSLPRLLSLLTTKKASLASSCCLSVFIITVIMSGLPVRMDRSWMSFFPEMAAKHFDSRLVSSAGTSWPSGMTSSAICCALSSKYATTLGLTSERLCSATLLAACMTCWVVGGLLFSKRNPSSRSSLLMPPNSWALYSITAVPFCPARPVRPDRCTKVSVSKGGLSCTTRSTPEMSRPRAATSVATSTWNLWFLNCLMQVSLSFCDMSPCSGWADTDLKAEVVRWSHSALVWANTIARLPLPCTAIRSSRMPAFRSRSTSMETWFTVVASRV
mmetsp:Transcript_2251/g.3343  ORF Transcript_2251/g.3343 Transcript_2251/m.3343 type:complete len:306 (-) Transcript_2251:1428-2345(-)